MIRDSAEDDEEPIEERFGLPDEDEGTPEDELYEQTAGSDDEVYDGTAGPGGEPAGRRSAADAEPDVFLDVPLLKVDQIDLDVEDLRAHVSLQAEVLDLLKLNVGADVALGRVHLGISGVEARARLEVRLDNVALIINRVLTTLDRNPQILEELTRGVGAAVQDVGAGARQAVGELGTGASRAVGDIGSGAGAAVRDVGAGAGRGVERVGRGAERAVEGVGRGAGAAVEGVGRGAGAAVEGVGRGAASTVEGVGRVAGGAVEDAATGVGQVVEDVPAATEVPGVAGVRKVAGVPEVADTPEATDVPEVADVPDRAGGAVRRAAAPGRTRPRRPDDEHGEDPAVRSRRAARARRVRDKEGKPPPRAGHRRTTGERDGPPP
ncbi:hypothetical protein [Streptomyces sp. SCL15-4]|uniref:hypothetical protein n=1 Tax=Streptomyces sp. SCL15-4 TaxID=2967221 RepID=UPI002966084A|nr:hypothetical protein [Streptomyces sp. SCL15-4]